MQPGSPRPNPYAPQVEILNQVLVHRLPLAGTACSLSYRSDRASGRRGAFRLVVPLVGRTVPAGLSEVAVEVEIAGQRLADRHPASADLRHVLDWNGNDADGNVVRTRQPATVRIDWAYRAAWPRPARTRRTEHVVELGVDDARSEGLGGWTLDATAGARVPEVERDQHGGPSAIVGADGARTLLDVNEQGYLASIVDPAGARVELQYDAGGLLRELRDPQGGSYRYDYDELGRLTEEQDAMGTRSIVERAAVDQGREVAREMLGGGRQVLRIQHESDGAFRQESRCCGGQLNVTERGADGTITTTLPDGSRWQWNGEGDETSLRVDTPAGHSSVLAVERGRGDGRVTTRFVLNGRVHELVSDADGRSTSYRSAAGRVQELVADEHGLPIELRVEGMAPMRATRGPGGEVAEIEQGGLRARFERDAAGRPKLVAVGMGHPTAYRYDAAGRMVRMTLPSGRAHELSYSPNGNLVEIVTPGGARHAFEYDAGNRCTRYLAPDGAAYRRTYDPEHRPLVLELPSGRQQVREYDAAGRLSRLDTPEARVELQYADGAWRAAGIERQPVNGDGAQALSFEHDGDLLVASAWSGAATGSFRYRYDADRRLAEIDFDGDRMALERDDDGRLTGIGPFRIERAGPAGRASRIADGNVDIRLERDELGRVVRRILSVGGTEIHRFELAFDDADRVVRRTEAGPSGVQLREFTYDADGQLVAVNRDGLELERYAYDPNGNRISARTSAGQVDARIGPDDRLLQVGSQPYEVDEDGFATGDGTHRYRYGARGELLRAEHPGGEIVYAYDGLGRRVARTDAGGTTQYLYGDPEHRYALSIERAPSGEVSRFVYDDAGHCVAMRRGEAWFAIATDQVGTPRVVADADGRVVRELHHDSFGNLLDDSNPEFRLPIGFGGGLADPTLPLVRFGRRDYDPRTGRWTAKDPLGFAGSDPNLYAYVRNDPLNRIDRNGLQQYGRGDNVQWVPANAGGGNRNRGGSGGFTPGFDFDFKGVRCKVRGGSGDALPKSPDPLFPGDDRSRDRDWSRDETDLFAREESQGPTVGGHDVPQVGATVEFTIPFL